VKAVYHVSRIDLEIQLLVFGKHHRWTLTRAVEFDILLGVGHRPPPLVGLGLHQHVALCGFDIGFVAGEGDAWIGHHPVGGDADEKQNKRCGDRPRDLEPAVFFGGFGSSLFLNLRTA